MDLAPGKKIYFLSDFHLGAPNIQASRQREDAVVAFLKQAKQDAAAFFIVGDIFDFWFEYQKVVPQGFIRLLGKLAIMADKGIKIHIFTGNHDLWINHYLPNEFNCIVYRNPVITQLNGKTFYIAHGDGLGPGDKGFKFLKSVFTNKFCQSKL